MPAVPAPEREILRSVIDFGSDKQDTLQPNLKKLVASNLAWTDPSFELIFGYVKSYWVEHEEAPTDDIIRAHFEGIKTTEALAAIEVLGDIEVSRAWSTTNFDETLTSAVRFQQNIRLQFLMKQAGENFKKHSLENNNNSVLTIINELNNALATSSDDAAIPTIQLGPKAHITTQACVEALKADPDIYMRGRELVAIIPPDEAGGTSTIEPVPVSVLTNVHLSRVANFEHEIKRGWVATKPTRDLGQTIAELKQWPGLRFLRGVTNVPLMRPDGSILSEPGYDAATRLLVDPRVEVLPVPESPTLEDAKRALTSLTSLLVDFPIVGSGTSTWLAAILTFFGREMFDGPVPAVIIDSNNPGTGKGLLTQCMGFICMGEVVSAYAFIENEDEMRKRVTSILIQGKGLVLIDNVGSNSKFGVGPTWNSLLTATTFADRVLGVSQAKDLPNRSVWLVTGVNVDVAGDCTRRFVTCRLETDLEHPEMRDPEKYHYPDLVGYVRSHRPELIQAVLTILRGWVVANRPKPTISLGSYEEWSKTICACIEWLGLPSPIVTRSEYAERRGDTGDTGVLAPLLMELEPIWGVGPHNSHSINELLKLLSDEDDRVRAEQKLHYRVGSSAGMNVDDLPEVPEADVLHKYQGVRDALLGLCPMKGSGLPNSRYVGKRFAASLSRPAGGLKLSGQKAGGGLFRWWLDRVTEGNQPRVSQELVRSESEIESDSPTISESYQSVTTEVSQSESDFPSLTKRNFSPTFPDIGTPEICIMEESPNQTNSDSLLGATIGNQSSKEGESESKSDSPADSLLTNPEGEEPHVPGQPFSIIGRATMISAHRDGEGILVFVQGKHHHGGHNFKRSDPKCGEYIQAYGIDLPKPNQTKMVNGPRVVAQLTPSEKVISVRRA